jgi:hypothetical protein
MSHSDVLILKNKAPDTQDEQPYENVRELSFECNVEIFLNSLIVDMEENAVLHRSNAYVLPLNSYGRILTTGSGHRD